MSREPSEPLYVHQAYLSRIYRAWACIDHDLRELEIFIDIPKSVPSDWIERYLKIRATDAEGVLSAPLSVRWTDLTGSVLRCVTRNFPSRFVSDQYVRSARIGQFVFIAGEIKRAVFNLYAIDVKNESDRHDDRLP